MAEYDASFSTAGITLYTYGPGAVQMGSTSGVPLWTSQTIPFGITFTDVPEVMAYMDFESPNIIGMPIPIESVTTTGFTVSPKFSTSISTYDGIVTSPYRGIGMRVTPAVPGVTSLPFNYTQELAYCYTPTTGAAGAVMVVRSCNAESTELPTTVNSNDTTFTWRQGLPVKVDEKISTVHCRAGSSPYVVLNVPTSGVSRYEIDITGNRSYWNPFYPVSTYINSTTGFVGGIDRIDAITLSDGDVNVFRYIVPPSGPMESHLTRIFRTGVSVWNEQALTFPYAAGGSGYYPTCAPCCSTLPEDGTAYTVVGPFVGNLTGIGFVSETYGYTDGYDVFNPPSPFISTPCEVWMRNVGHTPAFVVSDFVAGPEARIFYNRSSREYGTTGTITFPGTMVQILSQSNAISNLRMVYLENTVVVAYVDDSLDLYVMHTNDLSGSGTWSTPFKLRNVVHQFEMEVYNGRIAMLLHTDAPDADNSVRQWLIFVELFVGTVRWIAKNVS